MRPRKDDGRAVPGLILGALLLAGGVSACSPKRSEQPAETKPQQPTEAKPRQTARTDIVLTGAEAMGDWTSDAPGVKRKITVADLPPPNEKESVSNRPRKADRPAGALPKVPAGFTANEFASGLENPRVVKVAPNGDVFVVESREGRVQVLRDTDKDGKAESRSVYVEGLKKPFGLAFYPADAETPTHVYIANTDSVVRYPYRPGDSAASGPAEKIVDNIPSGGEALGGGGHWTRDIAFSKDNQRMFVSVGSRSNVSDDDSEKRRASILAFTPDGKNEVLYASGIRNPVGIAIEPATGALWTSVNERDELGDNLVPDYVTRVQEGGFYGWPWFYLGKNQDPRHEGKHPALRDKVIVPDVLIQSHSASLAMCFYTGQQFPPEFRGHIFAAEHGSWNRSRRTGYKVIRVPVTNGKAEGYYEDFLTGFVNDDGDVWGRPVGVAVARDGALLVTDDQSNTVWRVAFGR
ncbi:PQQ-dependent sugar dehydrogenase [Chondromyces crocatus]|uniref:Sorbosone dehydrogenase n=1 Tax=Chondromyces crocatus TaxID=52 RepID=A0A0K1EM82_CHOCO|nr:sorbosone dehydrogenase family protein [Chondromyces crocatus]AKT41757.1 sorbosone dehydrogenase [Chondromyces crocatus]